MRESGATPHSYTFSVYQQTQQATILCFIGIQVLDTSRSAGAARVLSGEGNAPFFMRLRRDATNLYADISRDRVNWILIDQRTVASVFLSAPNQVGIMGNGKNAAPDGLILHYLSGSL
jgi:hypothetical protein